ncbi:hypothetical protein J437_LFUL014367 [Ladona fulva]|uniref:Uncharacterized protein n=1 Tax=Ladona fulva TaxID=123851 RepID=A0A8K0P9F6_LADFU|nr:hypothetical protein J437_LFUL014542 [Ladona fulva]KAG8238057.1 hypothetical protein J437_LFUL014367 [Ladona fulva]
MELHGPIFQKTYYLIVNCKESASDAVCKLILHRSVEEEKEKTLEANSWEDLEGSTKGLTLSGYWAWRKRGFNSLQGVSIVIGNFSGIIKYWTYRLGAAIVKRANLGRIKKIQKNISNALIRTRTTVQQISKDQREVDAIREILERSVPSYGVKYLN